MHVPVTSSLPQSLQRMNYQFATVDKATGLCRAAQYGATQLMDILMQLPRNYAGNEE